jgi:poly(3-hydroxyalkanoate) depolymerase
MTVRFPPASVRLVRAHGTEVRVSVRGKGPPLLMFMGIGAPLELWERFEREMSRYGRRLIALDLPGTGGSPAAVPPMRMRGLVKVAAEVLDHLGVDRVDVLGVSYGGAVAQEFAHRAPERTRRLVLAATSTGMLGLPAKPSVLVHLATPLRYWSPGYAQRIVGDIYGGRSRTDPWAHRELRARFERPPSAMGYVGQLWAALGWTSVLWLPRLAVPTLVMTGDDDPIIPTVNGHILAWLIPDARLHVVHGGGHLFLLEEAAASAAVVDEFLGPPA